MAPDDNEANVEVFRCTDELEVNRVCDELLVPEGIECVVHDRTIHALPSRAEAGAYFIAVPASQARDARTVLALARQNGELDEDSGDILP